MIVISARLLIFLNEYIEVHLVVFITESGIEFVVQPLLNMCIHVACSLILT